MTIKAPVSIQGVDAKAVVDTGAEVTVISDRFYHTIPKESRPPLRKTRRGLVVADAHKEMKTNGITELDFILGEVKFKWPVYVAPIRDDILFGCDIIDELNISVNTKKGIQVHGKWIACDVFRTTDKSAQVKVSRSITIPANTELILVGQCDAVAEETTYAFEASQEAQQKLLLARCMVTPVAKKVPVRVLNSRPSPTKLKKGLVLGILQEVGTVMKTDLTLTDNNQFDGISICRVKDHGCKHQRELPSSTVKEYLESKDIRAINHAEAKKLKSQFQVSEPCPSTFMANQPEKTLHQMPDHLTELYGRASEHLSEEQKYQLTNLLNKHSDAFAKSKTDLGKCSVLKHHIDTGNAAPVKQPLRRTPQAFEGEEERYLKEQLENGTIQPSTSAWASPLVMVRKKTGDVRVCVDYRKLNERTIKDAYPLPRINMCLDCLASSKIFSTIDLQNAYMQLEVAEEDRHKTAFISKYGLFEYSVLPFGVCNGPSTFQRCVELIFRGLQWEILLVYLDDIIVMGQNFEDHMRHLDTVFGKLFSHKLKMKPSKCELFQPEVLFLGHIVGQNGLRPNPKTIEAVLSWKEPGNVREIRQYLGLCSYYRQYIEGFSHIAAPLTKLTKKNAKYVWSNDCQVAFDTLKQKLCSAPILAYPKPGLKYILDCDASDVGIGGVLSQVQNGKERVIAYASKRLTPQQEKYSVTRRELLAVIVFMDYFRHYLLGQRFLLRTDHGSLRWIFDFKDPKGQVARWLEVISQYDFDIEHRPGTKHLNADALSRKDFYQTRCEHTREDSECPRCLEIEKDWEHFSEEIDDIVDLGIPVNNCNEIIDLRSIVQKDRTIHNSQDMNSAEKVLDPEKTYLPCYTNANIESMQREDEDLIHLHTWVDNRELPSREEVASCSPTVRKYWLEAENLIRQNGVLYRKLWLTANKKSYRLQMLVPRILRQEIIRNNHDNITAGHFGRNKTALKIREKFYWYKLDEDVKIYIHCCDRCNRFKRQKKKPRARQRKYQVGYPMDRVGIDIYGPLPQTERGHKYILVVGDYFTRYMEAYCLPDQQAETVAHTLVTEFIARYGTPLEIHSDQGRNFESDLFKKIMSLLSITKTRTVAYKPSGNGMIERFNGTLGKMIQKFVYNNKNSWDKYVSLLMAAYRSTPHPATGYTPNFLMFGHELNLPQDILYPYPRPEAPPDEHEYVAQLRDNMEDCYHVVREFLRASAERQKKNHDTRLAEHMYNVGDAVYKLTGMPKKLDPLYSGPYIITKVLSPAVYEIKGKKKIYVTHHDRLKPFQSELPQWAKTLTESLN